MRFVIRILKAFALLVGVLVLAIAVPVVPVEPAALGDPSNHTDQRIHTELSDEDLRQILRLVRRGKLNSIFEIVRYQTRQPLLHVAKSEPKFVMRTGSKNMEHQEAKGQVEVELGVVCGRLCGSGITFYLEFVKGKWRVIEATPWIA